MDESVPPEWVIPGSPRWGDPPKGTCKVCGAPYIAHPGKICAICRDPVEHHKPGEFEARCLDGQRRMARARFLADVPLDDVDRLALRDG